MIPPDNHQHEAAKAPVREHKPVIILSFADILYEKMRLIVAEIDQRNINRIDDIFK